MLHALLLATTLTVAEKDVVSVLYFDNATGNAEYDVVVTTDGTSDPENENNLGYLYSASKGQLGSDVVAVGNVTTVYIAVLPYQARNGKYALSVRKIAAN